MTDAALIQAGDEVQIVRTGESGLVIEWWRDHGKWLVEMYAPGDPIELHAEEEMVVIERRNG